MSASIRLFAFFSMMSLLAQPASVAAPRLDLSDLFADFTGTNRPGASVLVVHRGKTLFSAGFGMADLRNQTPCGPETNFRLASVSKQFTAMAILILVQAKKLSLDEPLTDIFPGFPSYGSGITVQHLLQHTSGIWDYEELIPKGTVLPVLDRDVLRILMDCEKTWFPPGTQYRYSNSGYALLAQIVELRSGQTFAAFLRERVFQPLKMKNTVAYERGISTINHRAYGHSLRKDNWHRTDQSLTSSVLGDGGIYSSITDLALWDRALYSTKLVPARLLQQAFTPGPQTEHPNTGYGFGWYIGQYRGLKEIWHSGNTIGFTTRIARYPEKNFTVIILCNRTDADLAPLLHKLVDQVLFASESGHPRTQQSNLHGRTRTQ